MQQSSYAYVAKSQPKPLKVDSGFGIWCTTQWLPIGACKGGSRDSGFKFQTDQGFWIRFSKGARFWIHISKWVGFWIQISTLGPRAIKVHFLTFRNSNFKAIYLGFIFQNGLESGFKFQIGGIQDSDLGLQGPTHE